MPAAANPLPSSAPSILEERPEPARAAAHAPLLNWLFVDMNSYFASVEQDARPELRGRPVAIVPMMADSTCCIAASYEAKAFGVKTGTLVADAKRMCPGIVLVEARHEIYVEYHHRIVAAVESCLPVTAVLSIDEMACRLLGRERPLLAALALGRQVKARIQERVGPMIRSSVGLATNRYLAKIASDMEKPDGLVALPLDILPEALRQLTLRDLPGVGPRMEKRLNAKGIYTMDQLLALNCEQAGALWDSVWGERLWHWLHGADFDMDEPAHLKSLSHQHVLAPEMRTPEKAWAVAHKLLHKAAMRLRTGDLWAGSIGLAIGFSTPRGEKKQPVSSYGVPTRGWKSELRLSECQDDLTLISALRRLWESRPSGQNFDRPYFVGVHLNGLVPGHLHTLNLFDGSEGAENRKRLQASMDALNSKYGLSTLAPATMLAAFKAAPTRYDAELNPVFPGCYTTQVEMKRHNRQSEQLLLNAEKMSEMAVFFNYRDYYPVRDFSEAWKLVLLNQAHDLAAGSGIGPIYADAAAQYKEIFQRGYRALNFSLQNLGLQLDTVGEGVPLVVYNPQSFDRTDLVTAEISAFSLPTKLVAVHDKETVQVQIVKAPAKDGARETATVAFVAQNVPQMGLKLYRLVAATGNAPAEASTLRAGSKPRPFLENEFLRVEIDPETGNIARLYDKANKREAFKGEGNSLTAWEDTAEQAARTSKEYGGPAWDTGITGKHWEIAKASRVEVTEQGPARATIRVVRRFRDSEFTQEISLMPGVPRVDVVMTLDWYERATMLKANFPVNAESSKVSVEIPYGAIERDQTGEEAVMGKWVDISGDDYGVAILNNGRNGYDAKGNAIHLSVIRGPWAPDPRADEGEHSFGYSIYPHKGGWRAGKAPFQAMAFNSPLLSMQEPQHGSSQEQWAGKKGGLPSAYSFIKTDSDHVALYALKQMEGFYDTDAIARFVEVEGREGDVTVQLPQKVRATETTLLEDVIVGPVGEGTTIKFHMKPWEIKTLRLSKMQ